MVFDEFFSTVGIFKFHISHERQLYGVMIWKYVSIKMI